MTSLLSIQYVTPTSHQLVDNSSCSTFKTAVQLPEMYQVRNMTTTNQRFVEGVHAVTAVKSPPLNHNRLAYVDALVDANALVIESIWQITNNNATKNNTVVPLRTFIQEVLKRSRTTYSTLQTALFYLFRSRPDIEMYLLKMQTSGGCWEDAYVSCGRRMFLASLVVASKFVQDKTYRNSAWAKIAGLPVSEVNAAERIFLNMIDYQLYISQPLFEQWHHLLHMHVERKTLGLTTTLQDFSGLPFGKSSVESPTTTSQQAWPLVPSPFLPPSVQSNQCDCQPQQVKKRKRSSNNNCCQPPLPLLSMSLPSSINSSPMQTPTQISPVRMNNGNSVFHWSSPTGFESNLRSMGGNKKRKYTVVDQQQQLRSSYNISNVRQQQSIRFQSS